MVLYSLLKKANFKIIIAHVNHHKRIESLLEEKCVLSLEDENTIVEVFHFHHQKDNFQAEAHKERYNFFYETAKKYNASAIITAHHYMDNLETILMNIIRGSNIYGYAGIKELTYYNDLPIIRPLLSVNKDDIYEYAKSNNIRYFEDASNESDDYLRNRIRHNVITELKKENPNLANSVSNYSKQLFEAFDYIRSQSIDYFEQNNHKIDVSTFIKLALIQKKDIINYICDDLGIVSSENKINDILDLIENPKPNLSYSLNSEYEFIKEYNICYISKITKKANINTKIDKNEKTYIEGYGEFILSENETNLIKDSLKISCDEPLPLTIRNRVDGDKLIIGKGHKKLKDFLIDKKVPKKEREKLLVVTNALNEIIWVLGYYKKSCEKDNFIVLMLKGE